MLNKLFFTVNIKASRNVIWKTLWDEHSYRDWAGVFFEESYAVTDHWKEGSKVHFLAPDQSGIYSLIEKHVLNKTMHFKHIGTVVDGKEQPIDDASRKWTGATEIYTLTEGKDTNTLTVEIDVLDGHLEFMSTTFPKALEKIKSNCGQ